MILSMKTESAPAALINTPTMARLGRRVFLAISGVALVVTLLWLVLAWHNTKHLMLQRMTIASTLAAGHSASLFDLVREHLEHLAGQVQLSYQENDASQAHRNLTRFIAHHEQIGAASVILPDGRIWVSTMERLESTLPSLADPALGAWHELERSFKTEGFSIARPYINPINQTWVLPLRYTLSDAQTRQSIVLEASIELERHQQLWRSLPLEPGTTLGLVRNDGYVLSQWPHKITSGTYKQPIVSTPLFHAFQNQPGNGHYDAMSFTGAGTAGAYSLVKPYPVFAYIMVPASMVRTTWWNIVQLPLTLIGGALLLSALLYAGLARRFSQRMEAIRMRLADSATAAPEPLPGSGIVEIDVLYRALLAARDHLREASRNREKQLLAAAHAGTYTVRQHDGVVIAADAVFAAMLGKTPDQLLGHTWDALRAPMTQELFTLDQPQPDWVSQVVQFQLQSGEIVWLTLAEYTEERDGVFVRQGLAIDVTERETLLHKIQGQSTRLHALWELVTNRAMTDEQRVALTLRFGLERLNMDIVMVGEIVGDQFVVRHIADTLNTFHVGQTMPLESTLCNYNSQERGGVFIPDLATDPQLQHHPTLLTLGIRTYASAPIWIGLERYGALVFLRRDPLPGGISDDDKAFMDLLAAWFGVTLLQDKQRSTLENLAMTDSLTGLPNRRAADSRLAGEIARAKRRNETIAIALCDLDHFKLINDHYGHDVGDDVLHHAAQVMQDALREGDWMARWGGEEFFVFLHRAEAKEALAAMERVRHAVKSAPAITRREPVYLTTSIGVGVLHDSHDDVTQLLAEADGCLYEAKRSGRDRVILSEGQHRGTLWQAGQLQRALQEGRIVPAYQNIVDLGTELPIAKEVLARLIAPTGPDIDAKDFVEAAEGINLVHIIDQVITSQAMHHCVTNIAIRLHPPSFMYFVNLSPQFLARRDLVHQLIENMHQFCNESLVDLGKIKPIIFEITERQPLRDFHGLRHDLQPLLDLGFRLALDDFGSGYSSFLYLAELPISYLKIEGWLVRNLHGNAKVRAIVENIVQLSQQQGIITIAECIEDAETAHILREIGADWGQGYYYGLPQKVTPNSPS